MASNRIELNHGDLKKLLQTDGLKAARKVADEIMDLVGDEYYEVEEWVGRNRGRARVATRSDGPSMGHEAKYHDLIWALGSVHID